VLVPVAVVDRQNHPATGLEKENFRVFDDGVERAISFFAMENEPVAVELVFDHSGSVDGGMRLERGVAHWFLGASNPQDEHFLVLFASRPVLGIPLTPSPEEIQSRILTTIPTGSTALLDAVVLGLHEVRKSNLSRKALLVISDGGENNSRYTKGELKRMVAEGDALIYASGIDTFQANFPLLRWMAELSGGRAFPATLRDMPDIVSKIGTELRNRYVLGFSYGDLPRDGRHHSLRVQLVPPRNLPPLRAFWRRGYFAPAD
jgi:Ca-activated chloride channel homolog